MPLPSFRHRLRGRERGDTEILLLGFIVYYFFIVLVKKVIIFYRQRNSFDFQTAKPREDVRIVYSSCVGIARCLPKCQIIFTSDDDTCTTMTTCDFVNRQVDICVGNNNIIICKLGIKTNNCTHRTTYYIWFVKIRCKQPWRLKTSSIFFLICLVPQYSQ